MNKLPIFKNGFTLARTLLRRNLVSVHGFTLIRTPFQGNLVSDKRGFTLIELLIVITILGILATIALTSFQTSQQRARDGQRKSDLKQVSNALELYYADHGVYPGSSGGQIQGCPSTSSTACTWGSVASGSEFTDGNTVYLSRLPKDPRAGTYYYEALSSGQKYQLFARLENPEDKNCIPNQSTSAPDCNPASGTFPNCNSGVCNFAVTSTNATPYE